MEEKEILEGKKEEGLDNLDVTSASEVEAEKEVPSLDNSPEPTEEQQADADMAEPELNIDDLAIEDEADATPAETETVESEPTEEVHEELGVTDMPAMKTFTQSQVDEIAGKVRFETREKTFRYIYDRYGVENEQDLDELVGNAQRFDSLKEEYDGAKASWKHDDEAKSQELADIKEHVALLESGIDKNRYEDAKFILKGKGLEINAENINAELATHPEWAKLSSSEPNPTDDDKNNYVKVADEKPMPAQPVSKISVLGNEQNTPSQDDIEEEYAMKKMFKV